MTKAKKSTEVTRLAQQRPAWSDVLECGEEQESFPPSHPLPVKQVSDPSTRKKGQMQNRRLTREELVVKETAYAKRLSAQQKQDQDEGWNDSVWDGFSSGNEGTTMTGRRSGSGDSPNSSEVAMHPPPQAQRLTQPEHSANEGVGQTWKLRVQEKNTFLAFEFPDGQDGAANEEMAFSPRARSEPDVCGGQGGINGHHGMQGSLTFPYAMLTAQHSMPSPKSCAIASQFQEYPTGMHEPSSGSESQEQYLTGDHEPMPAGQGIWNAELQGTAASRMQRTSTSTQKGASTSTDHAAKQQDPNLHETGRCKPCAFLTTVGCRHGASCEFCHLRHGRGHPRASKAKRHRFKRLVARTVDADQKHFNHAESIPFNYSQDGQLVLDGRTDPVPQSPAMSYSSGVSLSMNYNFGKEMPGSQAGYGPRGGQPQFEAPRNVRSPLAAGIMSQYWQQPMVVWDRSGISYCPQ